MQVPLQHCLDPRTDQAVVGAKYLAKAVFVGAPDLCKGERETVLHLEHGATIADLKAEWCGRSNPAVTTIICRDVEGRELEDHMKLPAAKITTCADFGFHAEFFLNLDPPSMRHCAIKQKLCASEEAIDQLVKTPGILGDWSVVRLGAVKAYEGIGKEMRARLLEVKKPSPPVLSTEPIGTAKAQFEALGGSRMAKRLSDYASEASEEILSKDISSLDETFPQKIASPLTAMLPFVKRLEQVQEPSEWVSYNSTTTHPDGFTLGRIVSRLAECLQSSTVYVSSESGESVRKERECLLINDRVLACGTFGMVQEDVELMKESTTAMTSDEKKLLREECEALDPLHQALHAVLSDTWEKQRALEEMDRQCKQECDEFLGMAKDNAMIFEQTLKEAKADYEAIDRLQGESSELHQLAREQIQSCTACIEHAMKHTSAKIESLDIEIKRLEAAKKAEAQRLIRLQAGRKRVDSAKSEEEARAQKFAQEIELAKSNAAERLKTGAKGVESSKRLVKRLEELSKQVQLDFESALTYGTEVLKSIAVDCHAAFLGQGKFLAIKDQKLKRTLKRHGEALGRAKESLEDAASLEDYELPSTVADADRARQEFASVEADFNIVTDMLTLNTANRMRVKDQHHVVDAFLRKHRKHVSSAAGNGLLIVEALPMTPQHTMTAGLPSARYLEASSVAEFREMRALVQPLEHQLESLDDYERDFEKRYYRDLETNRRSRNDGYVAALFARIGLQ